MGEKSVAQKYITNFLDVIKLLTQMLNRKQSKYLLTFPFFNVLSRQFKQTLKLFSISFHPFIKFQYIFPFIIQSSSLYMSNTMMKIPKGARLQQHMSMDRYMKQLPSIFNAYYQTNLLEIIDQLPEQPKKHIQSAIYKTNISTNTKNQSFNSNVPIQNNLNNVVIAFKHECDGLGNDIEINNYKITKIFLGKGSHSFVKQAKKQGITYAIKTISFDRLKKRYYIKDHHITKMINCQINLLLKLKSPQIIGFYQAIYSIEKQRIFIVLQYCSKGSLLKVINSSASIPLLEWQKTAKKYFIEMTKGMLKIHESNVIHRDMKTENVLINDKDEVKIIDFNVSSEISPNGMITITDKFIGTKTYAPPQLVIPSNKPREVDGRLIDIWALGVTFLELWERKHPFNVNSIEELIKILEKPIQINKSYDPDLKNLLQRMLHLENKERIQAIDILNHPWIKK